MALYGPDGTMKICVERTQSIKLRGVNSGKTALEASLSCDYYDFIRLDGAIPRPPCEPHRQRLRLRVRLTRPDGSVIEPFASVVLVHGHAVPAILCFSAISASEIPIGTEVELLRYETHAV